MVDKVALSQIFSEYFGFPCQFLVHRLVHIHHHLSPGAGTIGQLVADVPSVLSLTPRQGNKKKLNSPIHNPKEKKSSGDILGERGCQGIDPSSPIHLFREVMFKRFHCEAQCGGAPSCWKKTFGWRCAICETGLKSFTDHFNCVAVYWRPTCALLMQDTTCRLKLFKLSLDGPSSKCLFSTFPAVVSLHLNDWLCIPAQHKPPPSAGGNIFCIRQLCAFQQCHCRPCNHLTWKIFGGPFEQCSLFPDISKTWWFM
jgi:hypothetical protein